MLKSSTTADHSVVTPGPRATARGRALAAVLCLAVLAAVGAAAARAGSCRVLVALGSVDMEPSPAGMSLRISGNWEFDNLVQVVSGLSYNVLIVREDNFVRLRYPDQAFSGFLTGLAAELDAGIDGGDLLAVEGAGAIEPSARFVTVEAQRMKISSPVPPGSGPISVVAYLVLDGDYISPIISNTLTRALEVEPIKESEVDEPDGTGGGDVPDEPVDPEGGDVPDGPAGGDVPAGSEGEPAP
ncbi:MAG: hypothetical protein ABR538_13040 [Candidatus Binatia bacterium]